MKNSIIKNDEATDKEIKKRKVDSQNNQQVEDIYTQLFKTPFSKIQNEKKILNNYNNV